MIQSSYLTDTRIVNGQTIPNSKAYTEIAGSIQDVLAKYFENDPIFPKDGSIDWRKQIKADHDQIIAGLQAKLPQIQDSYNTYCDNLNVADVGRFLQWW